MQRFRWYLGMILLFLWAGVGSISVQAKDSACGFVERELLVVLNPTVETGNRSFRNAVLSEEYMEAYGITSMEERCLVFEDGESRQVKTARDGGRSSGLVYYKVKLEENNVLEAAKALEELENVISAQPNYIYEAADAWNPGEQEDPALEAQWFLEQIEARDAWRTLEAGGKQPGEDVVIALLDTGIYTEHEDLKESLWVNEAELSGTEGIDDDSNGCTDDLFGYNFAKDNANVSDSDGHGTQLAGIMAMTAGNGVGGAGVAYGAKVMPVKVSTNRYFDTDTVVQGIAYAVENGADVINMSFGGTQDSWLLRTALQEASSRCILVAAAGNNGYPTTEGQFPADQKTEDVYPAGYSFVIGVMSRDMDGKLSEFSNWDCDVEKGASYEIAAPGNGLYTTGYRGKYETARGSSHATAVVSAAAAILRGIYIDRKEYAAPVLTQMFLDSQKDRMTYRYSDDLSVDFRCLNLKSIIEYALQEHQIADGLPPEGTNLTREECMQHEIIRFCVAASDNIGLQSVRLYYKSSGVNVYAMREMTCASDGIYLEEVPADVRPGEVSYFFELTDGVWFTYVGSREEPLTLTVREKEEETEETDANGRDETSSSDDQQDSEESEDSGGLSGKTEQQKKDLSGCRLEFAVRRFVYNGKKKKPVFLIYDGDVCLEETVDYRVVCPGRKTVGTGTVQIFGTGMYSGCLTGQYYIYPGKIRYLQIKAKANGTRLLCWRRSRSRVTGYGIYAAKKKSGPFRKIGMVRTNRIVLSKKMARTWKYLKVSAIYRNNGKELTGKKTAAVRI